MSGNHQRTTVVEILPSTLSSIALRPLKYYQLFTQGGIYESSKVISKAINNLYCCCCSVSQSFLTVCNLWTAARQACLSFTISWILLKFMSVELVTPSNHLILCHPLLLPSIFPSIRVFSNESALHIRWPKYWSFSFSVSPSHEYSGLISFRIDWFISLQSKGLSRIFYNTTVQKPQFFSAQPSLWLYISIRR